MDITQGTARAVNLALESAGKSQLSASEQTGIPRTTLLRRLSGVSPFTVDELQRIADLLGVPVHSLIETTDNGGRVA